MKTKLYIFKLGSFIVNLLEKRKNKNSSLAKKSVNTEKILEKIYIKRLFFKVGV